jgi:hypothetical protein
LAASSAYCIARYYYDTDQKDLYEKYIVEAAIYNYKAAIRKRAKDLTTFDAAINQLCNVIG